MNPQYQISGDDIMQGPVTAALFDSVDDGFGRGVKNLSPKPD